MTTWLREFLRERESHGMIRRERVGFIATRWGGLMDCVINVDFHERDNVGFGRIPTQVNGKTISDISRNQFTEQSRE